MRVKGPLATERTAAVERHEIGLVRHTPGRPRRGWFVPYLFVGPFYALYAAFFVLPVGLTVLLGFSSWDGVGAIHFTGVRNFTSFASDGVLKSALFNTGVYVAGALAIAFFLALPLAMVLSSRALWGKPVLRVLYFSPLVTPPIAAVVVFFFLFGTQDGVVDDILHFSGLPRVDWLASFALSKVTVLILVAWQWTGLTSIYFLAGLEAIPAELKEAAAVDGAGRWGLIRYMILPLLRPTMVFVSVVVFIGSAQIFDQSFALFDGGPGNSSISLVEYIYNTAFTNLQYGYASAIALALLAAVGIVAIVEYRLLSRSVGGG